MGLRGLLLPSLALGLAGLLLAPGEEAAGFLKAGYELGIGQRDLRVFNNFLDTQANNNQTASVQFPGAQGAEMAIWKAAVEWGSEVHGNGTGDSHQGNILGSGNADFDFSWQGLASVDGNGSTFNIAHADPASGGNTFAVTSTSFSPSTGNSNGWTMKFFENHTWQDGPGSTNGVDIQGIATHELGHSLGLDHTTANPATMRASTTVQASDNQRSIEADDIAGVQSIYGVKSATKPHIDLVGIAAGVVTIKGTGFAASGIQVWFTTNTPTSSNGTPVKALNAGSTDGLTLSVPLPAKAGPGDVLVKNPGASGAFLSNAFPFDPAADPGPSGLSLTGVAPTQIEAVVVDGASVVLTGTGLSSVTAVLVDGVALGTFPPTWLKDSDTQITISKWPQASKLGAVDVEVQTSTQSATIQIDLVANVPPVLDVLNSDSEGTFLFSATGVTFRCGSKPGDVYFVVVSPEDGDTSIPGIVDLGIGNGNLLALFGVASPLIPAQGYFEQNLPIGSPPAGTKWFWQGAVFDATLLSFPLVPTNEESTTVLF